MNNIAKLFEAYWTDFGQFESNQDCMDANRMAASAFQAGYHAAQDPKSPWRSVKDDPPTNKPTPAHEFILCAKSEGCFCYRLWNRISAWDNDIPVWWMAIPPLPVPKVQTQEEIDADDYHAFFIEGEPCRDHSSLGVWLAARRLLREKQANEKAGRE